MSVSDLEAAFLTRWRQLGGSELEREHRFAPPRRWRVDFAHLGARVAIECEGGIYSSGRHVRGPGFEADAEKYNALSSAGWILFRITPGMLAADPMGTLAPILATIRGRSRRRVAAAARRTPAMPPSKRGGPKQVPPCDHD